MASKNEMLQEEAKTVGSAEELRLVAKENGTELTEEEAAAMFAEIAEMSEISDDELAGVTGGAGWEDLFLPFAAGDRVKYRDIYSTVKKYYGVVQGLSIKTTGTRRWYYFIYETDESFTINKKRMRQMRSDWMQKI